MAKQTKIQVPVVPVGPIRSGTPAGTGIGKGPGATPPMIFPPAPAKPNK